MPNASAALSHMLTGQLMTGDVNDAVVLDALSSVAREAFVPEIFQGAAYIDNEISLGSGRFLLQPLVFARILKYANITKKETVLDVATGTGYGAAVLSGLAQKVVALEEDAKLAAKAKICLTPYSNVELVQSELVKGVSPRAPYDCIVIEGAIKTLPQALSDQLREGGRLLTVENMEAAKTSETGLGKLVEYRKIRGSLYRTVLHDASASLLPGFKKPASFKF